MIQEPPWNFIRRTVSATNPEGEAVVGPPIHPDWMVIFRRPKGEGDRPRVMTYVNKRLAAMRPAFRTDLADHRDILVLTLWGEDNTPLHYINVYSDQNSTAINWLCDNVERLPQLQCMAGDFNCHSSVWDPRHEGNNHVATSLIDAASDLGVEVSVQPVRTPTHFPHARGLVASVIDLMFLPQDRLVGLTHEVRTDWIGPSDHAPLCVTLPIRATEVASERLAMPKGSEEESSFLQALLTYIKSMDISNIDTRDALEDLIAGLARACNDAWNSNAKTVKVNTRTDSPGPADYGALRRATKAAKRQFFDERIETIATKNKRPWDLMNWTKQRNLPTYEAIRYNEAPYRPVKVEVLEEVEQEPPRKWVDFSTAELREELAKCSNTSAPRSFDLCLPPRTLPSPPFPAPSGGAGPLTSSAAKGKQRDGAKPPATPNSKQTDAAPAATKPVLKRSYARPTPGGPPPPIPRHSRPLSGELEGILALAKVFPELSASEISTLYQQNVKRSAGSPSSPPPSKRRPRSRATFKRLSPLLTIDWHPTAVVCASPKPLEEREASYWLHNPLPQPGTCPLLLTRLVPSKHKGHGGNPSVTLLFEDRQRPLLPEGGRGTYHAGSCASKPRVSRNLPASDSCTVWFDIWDTQSGANLKQLVNKRLSFGGQICMIRPAEKRPAAAKRSPKQTLLLKRRTPTKIARIPPSARTAAPEIKGRYERDAAALWILGAFRTSPGGGVETLAGLPPVHLHIKKLVDRSFAQTRTLLNTRWPAKLPQTMLNSQPSQWL
ncbi:hypothetical protein D9615_006148 [Tricholomella constricta]|uniref:Endonuclease/exonuclease/phosphatase domain-containing protein n=1 Tax=Tricholomella constricta TaxID=117010 RepID=A0A8H5M495_9AGAR|nr:hypothetical protein D9615_006148 [Tricholomella constricta]